MERQLVEPQMADVHELAVALLQQGERCAAAGLYSQAEAILIQVWTMSQGQDSYVAMTAAWEIAWLLVQRGAYLEASDWFSRLVTPPTIRGPVWPLTRHAIEQICRAVAGVSASQPAVTSGAPVSLTPAPAPALGLAPLKISNLGHFQIMRAGVLLPPCKSRKSVAILRYLLTQRHQAAHKEELMELFWPDASPRKAAHNLHVAVSALRSYLDPSERSYLLFEVGRYLIAPDAPIDDDCRTFHQLYEEAEQRRRAGDVARAQQCYVAALAYYQGDYYLDDHDYAWAIGERERLLARYLTTMEHLGNLFAAQLHFETAAECYNRLLERDPYREDIHCLLMRCYWQLGRRGEALRQYGQCQQILKRELGLEPAQELQTLYQAICASA